MKKKTYIIKQTIDENGFTLSRRNSGFSPLELLGVMELIQSEVILQMKGEIKPDTIKRKVIKRSIDEKTGKVNQ